MTTLGWIIAFTLLGGVASALVAGTFLLLPGRARQAALPFLVSFATGALLGAALLGLLPEAVAGAGPGGIDGIGLALLGGIGLFFLLEKLVLWRHCHGDGFEAHAGHDHHQAHSSAPLILVGDAVHNALDGVLVAAAFMTDVQLGILAGVAVMAHEIPSEVGNFAVLLHAGMTRARALFFNVVTSLGSVVGGFVGYFALSQVEGALPYALAVSAACLLYVAVADLIPGLHRRVEPRAAFWQVLLISAGVGVTLAVNHFLPHH